MRAHYHYARARAFSATSISRLTLGVALGFFGVVANKI
jgi:hypothetical protein